MVTSVEARIILGCIPLRHGFWSALPVSDKALWELTEKLYHAGVPWSSSLICCWTCWELSLYLASTLWKTRAEQLSCVSGALWVTREALGCAADCRFSEVPVVNVDFFFLSWRKPSKNVGWDRVILQADELDGASQLSCLTSALSTSSSPSSMIALS